MAAFYLAYSLKVSQVCYNKNEVKFIKSFLLDPSLDYYKLIKEQIQQTLPEYFILFGDKAVLFSGEDLRT